MMEDGVVKPERDQRWLEDQHDIEENGGRREGEILITTNIKAV